VSAINSTSALLQRVLLPRAEDPVEVSALYLDGGSAAPTSRTSMRLPSDAKASFATYFNAFPASYWGHWTTVEVVHLRLALRGAGRLDVYRSTADGVPVHVHGAVVNGSVDLPLGLDGFTDGGWYWFDLTASDDDLVLESGGWYAPGPAPGRAAVAVGMPTFNRPTDCVATLAAIGADPLVLQAVTAVIIPDQGAAKVRDSEGFDAAANALDGKLRIIDQPNIGGSGGYARVMYEALRSTDCEQILFMDDDIVLEPDSILRALAFSRFAREPMLVGGQMLKLPDRSELHTMGEVVDRRIFMWRYAPGTEPDHDLAVEPLRRTPWLHRRVDVDYNAWWMCLIPRAVAEDVGLPLPLFIKWDDCEYGLRAAAAGYPTATVPGVAVWHMSFADKDDNSDWQSYFLTRNRLVAAALHLSSERPVGLLVNSLRRTLGRLLLLEYSTVALQHRAARDFLTGPEALFGSLPTALGEVRALRAGFADGSPLPDGPPADAPAVRRASPRPGNPVQLAAAVGRAIAHNLRPVNPRHHARPQLHITTRYARWYVLAGLDGVLVSTSDGRATVFRKRDRKLFVSMFAEAVRLHVELARSFPRMRRSYRAAFGDLTSIQGWKRVFER
jgi:galactofuranosylgalactofuranosylrhamnosyl-N-acetylglucosaminyl-diphospho-decaprenol beta-1,5/1,6-galactofuranosyltransferase